MAQTSSAPPYFQYRPPSILDRATWQRYASHPKTQPHLSAMRKVATNAPRRPTHPTATDYLAAKRRNDRAIVDNYWQITRGVLAARCILHCIDGDVSTGSGDAALDELWSHFTSPTWMVSNHIPHHDLPDTFASQLDLAGCEMAAQLAETLESMKPWIDAQSDTLAKSIVQEIDRRILTPFVEQKSEWWFDLNATVWNNWTGVNAGSILATCESLAAIGQPRPEARAKALKFLNVFLEKAFTPAGECDEGIGYWSYGIGYASIGWSRLSEADFRREVDVDRLKLVADYPRRVHLFGNQFYSGNDAGLTGSPPTFSTMWLAAATGSQWLVDWSAEPSVTAWNDRNFSSVARLLDGLSRLPAEVAPIPSPTPSRFLVDQQAALFTSGSIAITLAGGNNAENHNHNDLGHFNVWVDGHLIVPDLGAPHYSNDFFGPRRYTYLTASSRGHCCPIINGHEQLAGRSAEATVLEINLDAQRLALQINDAYPPAAGLNRWTRTLERNAIGYTVRDSFLCANDATIDHFIWSTVEPKIENKIVSAGGLKIECTTPHVLTVEVVDPASHHLREFAHTLYRINFACRARQNVPLDIRTLLHK